MKYFLLLIALGFAGCASSEKHAVAPTDKPAAPAPALPSKVAPAPAEQKLSCIHGSETRFLEVIKKGNGCALNYTKAGKVTAVATASHGNKHCESSKEKIRMKLEKGDFKCN